MRQTVKSVRRAAGTSYITATCSGEGATASYSIVAYTAEDHTDVAKKAVVEATRRWEALKKALDE